MHALTDSLFDRFALTSAPAHEEDQVELLLSEVDRELDKWFGDRANVLRGDEKVVS